MPNPSCLEGNLDETPADITEALLLRHPLGRVEAPDLGQEGSRRHLRKARPVGTSDTKIQPPMYALNGAQ